MKKMTLFVVLPLLVAPLISRAQDEPAPRPAPGDRPAPGSRPAPGDRPNGPPRLPNLEPETIKEYFATVDQPGHAIALKFDLFMRGRGVAYEDAIAMLKEALGHEEAGSRRWLLLQSIQGFAGYHNPAGNADANAAYDAIFDRANSVEAIKALPPDVMPIFDQALTDYVTTVSMQGFGRGDNSTSPELLAKAFTTFILLPERPRKTMAREFDWKQAIKVVGGAKTLAAMADAFLKDPTVPSHYRALRAAASIDENLDVERSIELMEQAVTLLPDDPEIQQYFYSNYIRLLATNDRLGDAIKVQREVIRRSGRGRASLLALLQKANDQKAADEVLAELQKPETDESEIIEASETLRAAKNPDAARLILEAYVSTKRARTLPKEVAARVSLAHIYADQKNMEAAHSILQVENLKPPFDSIENQRLYNYLQNTLKRLDNPNEQ